MDQVKERRKHHRTDIKWPAIVITPNGLVDGKTRNLSWDGASLRCSQVPDTPESFRLVLKPAERKLLLATAKVVWTKPRVNETESHEVGIQFTYIPDDDRKFINDSL